jgi:hypothetical protein
MELSCVRRGGDLHVSKGPAFGLQALGSASQLLGAACVAQEWEGWRGPSLASDRGWRLEWMRPAGLHVSLHAAWLEYRWLSRSTANLTNGGSCVGRQIAARHGCPRIRFKLVASPCAHAIPPRINESAERPAPQGIHLFSS